ncbi:hypothetical protein PoB_006302100 [Plakobranchus ocellatus]|uniref:Uncharacterized protein n=1 Tax=Plakobranchus ocellatus TaxID=259542 RepID=A0AAV4CXD7_9GAST|nr:hypothetical protein PoB_006302100 [Plakobranchus ocellatus]
MLLQHDGGQHGFSIHRNIFGSCHGKNLSHGASAILKSAASRAVKCRKVQNANGLYNFCKEAVTKGAKEDGKCNHFKGTFIYINSADRKALPQVKPLPNTRLMHAFISNTEDRLLYRRRTCICATCQTGNHFANVEYMLESGNMYICSVDRERKALPQVKPLLNTRLMHAFISNTEDNLLYRRRTCICATCQTGNHFANID